MTCRVVCLLLLGLLSACSSYRSVTALPKRAEPVTPAPLPPRESPVSSKMSEMSAPPAAPVAPAVPDVSMVPITRSEIAPQAAPGVEHPVAVTPAPLPPLPPPTADSSADLLVLDRLLTCMVGQFSNAAQAARDPEYRDITLKVAPIWSSRTDGRWLYVEQALATDAAHPYRQCVYHITLDGPGQFRTEVLSLPGDPAQCVGAWADAARLGSITAADLASRPDCAMILRADGERFSGGTHAHDCRSDLRGAAYATSDATIDAAGMLTWDRGYDAAGKQVWGPTRGGYEFRKITSHLSPTETPPALAPEK